MAMYITDESADSIIVSNAKLRDTVQGNALVLWLPGQGAGVGANLCLMLCWMGALISLFRVVPVLRQPTPWYLLFICVMAASMGVHWFMVLRGQRAARRRMYRYAVATLAVGVIVTITALLRSDKVAAALVGVGTVFAFAAVRIIAGPSYALFAAFYRAKRAYESSIDPRQSRA